MILKSLYFNLDRQQYPNEYGYSLLLNSRFYCNYIERTVFKALKWKTQNFDRLVINFTDHPDDFFQIIASTKVLSVKVKFDRAAFEKAKKENLAEYFIKHVEWVTLQLKKQRNRFSDRRNRQSKPNIPFGKLY